MTKLQTSRCKRCGAEIVWIRTPSGKNMPCDAAERAYMADENGKSTVVQPNGKTVRCTLPDGGTIKPSDLTGLGYVPHWATCPNADVFRGGKKNGR